MLYYETRRTPFRRILHEYCVENFVYAMRYVANHRLLKFERSWWMAWLVTSLVACVVAVVQLYHKWDANPVVIVYAPKFIPIYTVPFPAITICPLTKTPVDQFNLTHAYQQVQNGVTLDEERELKLRALAHVCPFSHNWKRFDPREDEKIFQTLRSMALPKEIVAQWCLWRFKTVDCSDMITETLTDDGICYTFNALPANQMYRAGVISPEFLAFTNASTVRSNWTQEKGYRRNAGLHTYPHRPLSNGMFSGLFMVLSVRHIDQEFLCRGAYTGYKLTVHPPDEIALTGDRFLRLNNFDVIELTFTPNALYTARDLHDASPTRRKCFFNHERYLRFFNHYNQANCIAECVSNYTLKKCGCVKFLMPRTATMKICDASKIACYSNILKEVFEDVFYSEQHNKLTACQCLPACNSVRYQAEISRMPFYFKEFAHVAGPSFDRYEGYDPAILMLSFKHRHYLPVWRRPMLSLTDVVAKFGGLFALLMGASVMSVGEILYYCCIRPLRRERFPRLAINRIFVLPWAAHRNPFRVPRNY
ncbi:pickpocket [Culex quinquefasciatus]|uniref:Pickpocket n=1 Tax=Culex quinquefasciatus TaxID=7176 RepID=B0WKH6_CULQU|nr:pickpocket [Culex quinquefasciatus]|eukprot:XP_001849210.1 pickpocket [Culex quinquefasciatus]